MPASSPLSSNPYEVLGVDPAVSDDDLRRAFRRALRETHPDTGGDPARFQAVQSAWEVLGTPEARAAFDSGRSSGVDAPAFAARGAAPRRDSRPRTRSHGHPGGWRRESYLSQLREWVGRGVTIDDPYDPVLVRSAPREIRHTLADALAEEATARAVAELGIGFTVWHDVDTGSPERKIDHVVLGPTGLVALMSEDFGGPVRAKRAELIGEAVAGERPVDSLASRTKVLARAARVRFTSIAVVLPDDDLDQPILELGSVKGMAASAVRRSVLAHALRTGLPGAVPIGGTELFDVRTRLAAAIRFV